MPYSQMRAILCSIRPLPSFDDDLKWIWVHTPSTSKKYRPVTSLRHSSTVSQNWLERRRRWDARKNHKWRLQLDTGRRDGRGKRERERLQSSQPELRSTERPTEPTPSDQPTNQQSKCIAPYVLVWFLWLSTKDLGCLVGPMCTPHSSHSGGG